MFCKNCGTQLPDQAKFCFNCAAPQEPPSSAPSQVRWEHCQIEWEQSLDKKTGGILGGAPLQRCWARAVGPDGMYCAIVSDGWVGDTRQSASMSQDIITQLLQDGWEPTSQDNQYRRLFSGNRTSPSPPLTQIRVARESSLLMAMRLVEVFIDGWNYGLIGNGSTKIYYVSPGNHIVHVNINLLISSQKYQVNLKPGDLADFRCKVPNVGLTVKLEPA